MEEREGRGLRGMMVCVRGASTPPLPSSSIRPPSPPPFPFQPPPISVPIPFLSLPSPSHLPSIFRLRLRLVRPPSYLSRLLPPRLSSPVGSEGDGAWGLLSVEVLVRSDEHRTERAVPSAVQKNRNYGGSGMEQEEEGRGAKIGRGGL
jgi:hypothetical protein